MAVLPTQQYWTFWALLVALAGAKPARAADGAVVRTDKGLVRGAVAGNVRSFLGIPYAAPPVGNRRWQPPAAMSTWAGPRDATRPGTVCPQFRYWTNFARRGDPNDSGLPPWKPFKSSADVQSLAPASQGGIHPVDLSGEHPCAFWNATQPDGPR